MKKHQEVGAFVYLEHLLISIYQCKKPLDTEFQEEVCTPWKPQPTNPPESLSC